MTLKGVILANELSGSPIENVEVDAISANHTESDVSGKFTLEFPQGESATRHAFNAYLFSKAPLS